MRARRIRTCRRAALASTAALTLAALLSPFYTGNLRGRTWSATFTNGGLQLWWVDRGRTWGEPGASFRLGSEADSYSWRWRCAPHVWVPNAWLPAWIPLAPLWLATGAIWVLPRPARRGRCPHCAYSLAGLAAPALCPECGGVLSTPGGP